MCTESQEKGFGSTALGRTMRRTKGSKVTGTWVFFKTLTINPGECKQKQGAYILELQCFNNDTPKKRKKRKTKGEKLKEKREKRHLR